MTIFAFVNPGNKLNTSNSNNALRSVKNIIQPSTQNKIRPHFS